MPFICSICTGSLEQNPLDDPAALPGAGCLPCGHVFHQFCIDKWLGASGSEKVCPMCRKAVTKRKCLPLFHEFEEPSLLQDLDALTTDLKAAEKKETELQIKLAEALKEKTTLRDKLQAALDEKVILRNDLINARDDVASKVLAAAKAAESLQKSNVKIRGLEKKIQDLEKIVEKKTMVKVKPSPKTSAATATSRNPSPKVAPVVAEMNKGTKRKTTTAPPQPKPLPRPMTALEFATKIYATQSISRPQTSA